MSLAGKLRKLRDAATAPTTTAVEQVRRPVRDPYLHYPKLADVRQAARAGDWARMKSLLNGLPTADALAAASQILADSPDLDAVLASVIEADPADLDAVALTGARVLVQGWEIRGEGYADTVSQAQADAFHDHVRRADAMFLEVVSRDPAHVVAGMWRLLAVRALSHGQGELIRRYEQFARHHPHVYTAQQHVVQGLLPKWGGTWAQAREFTDATVAATPVGSHSHALIVGLHIEEWLALATGPGTPLDHPQVQADVLRAAEASVLHPSYRRTLGWVGVHNTFAFAFAQGHNAEYAAKIFVVLNNQMSRSPWLWQDDPEGAFAGCRDWARRVGMPKSAS